MARMKKRKDGLYKISATVIERGQKVRKYFYGKTQAEARRKMVEYQAKAEKGRPFRVVAEEWQEAHWKEIAPGTQVCYNPAFNRAVDAFGVIPIKEVRPLDIKRSVDRMAAQGYAHHSVVIYLSLLNQIFNYALLMQDCTENPTEGVKVPKGLTTAKRECPPDETLAIICKSVGEPFGLFPFMLYLTGMRRGELLALQWRDIDTGSRTISVTKSLSYADGNVGELKAPKTEAGEREIIMVDKLAGALLPLRRKPSDYVFGGAVPLTESQYRAMWRSYCLSVGLWEWKTVERSRMKGKKTECYCTQVKVPAVTPHQLRHAHATLLYDAGVEVKDAQAQLGHTKAAVTLDIYTHIGKSRKQRTAEKLNRAISGG